MYPTRYLNHLKHDPRPKLFGYKSPGAVRAGALRFLEDRDENDFLMRHSLRDAAAYQPLRDLIESWRPDGGWGTDRFYMRRWGEAAARDKALLTTARNLTLLHLYGWRQKEDDYEGYLEEATELLLARSQDDGFLQFISPDNGRLADEERTWALRSDHWPGIAVAALLNLGVNDRRIERFFEWLEANQRPDGGWLPEIELRRHASGGSLPSHPLHTTNFALALSSHPEWKSSATARQAAEFLVRSAFTTIGPYEKANERLWYRLSEPQWGFDALKVLTIALDCGLGPEDEGIMRIVDWLLNDQQTSGLWRSSRRRPGPDEDQFLTLKAVTAIKRIYDDLAPQPDEGG